MPALTNAAIQVALRSGRQCRLTDGGRRGAGRLVLSIKPATSGSVATWYAQSWRDGKRATVKIGNYPTLSLAKARERFSSDYAEALAAGIPIARAGTIAAGTVLDLVDGYVASLEQRGASSTRHSRQRLEKFADFVGGERPARDIAPSEVVEFLRPTFQRGKAALADHDRSYIRAAFSWGLRAEHDYTAITVGKRFRLVSNPAADIPTAPKVVGSRWLNEEEFRHLYHWLGAPANLLSPSYSVALRVLMLTGQRVQEIAGLRCEQWLSGERLLVWPTTKNGRPHAVPVCEQAAVLLDAMPRDGEWLFPADTDPERPVSHGSLYAMLWRKRESIGLAPFTNRDLRRTWKTLAGKAGLTKWERDLCQHHARTDVSSVHYDRHDYLEEKRQAVAKWDRWIAELLVRKTTAKSPLAAGLGILGSCGR